MTDQPPGHQPPGYQPSPAGEPTPPGGFRAAPYQGFPASGPMPAQPGYPASGPLPAQPGYPGSGSFPAQTGGFPQQQAPRRKGGAAVPLLAVAMVVFLAAAGVMVFLWLGASDDTKAHNDKLTALTSELSSTQRKTEEATESAASSQAKADDAGKDIAALEREISGLRRCADRVRETLIVAESGTDAELRAAVQTMFQNC
ncbi:hypothetical protein [Actinokineospora sp. UTMC 2448]|uniref:hypothetical protein n=1 Tax=Actinokineospora sp. UTMC 2448 TaxID=2268449 RepID=UPI00216484A8|nr:hypothetical protein [Actinokineospora sp. UTMC 2448]UVS81174.1 Membrane-bound metallopeptidase [Actinokineospora sp. UTMC 2448]